LVEEYHPSRPIIFSLVRGGYSGTPKARAENMEHETCDKCRPIFEEARRPAVQETSQRRGILASIRSGFKTGFKAGRGR